MATAAVVGAGPAGLLDFDELVETVTINGEQYEMVYEMATRTRTTTT